MPLNDQLVSALEQVGAVLIIAGIVYGITRAFRPTTGSFFEYIGLKSPREQIDRRFLVIWLGLALAAIVLTTLEYRLSAEFRLLSSGEYSPYSKILAGGFGWTASLKAIIYCFVQAAGSEEILFRGLIARRLFSAFGFAKGNLIQATTFWLMHEVMFRLITGQWISSLQFFAFVSSFGFGLILGYVNFRNGGRSITPSWILHGSLNFISLLTLTALAA